MNWIAYKGKVRFRTKNKFSSTSKGPFSKLRGQILIIFGVLESSERLLSIARKFGADLVRPTHSAPLDQKRGLFFVLNVI